jgi:hypothetical protein
MADAMAIQSHRPAANQAMARALRLWHTEGDWRQDAPILERLAAGLRKSLPVSAHDFRSCAPGPVNGNAHAHQLMSALFGHRCGRYYDALHHVT